MISMEILKLIVEGVGVIVGIIAVWLEYRKQRSTDAHKGEPAAKWEWD